MKVTLSLLFAALLLCGQDADSCVVMGKVVDAASGEPVRNTKLKLRRTDHATGGEDSLPTYVTHSNDQGRFAMKDIEPGKYELSAERGGLGAGDYPTTLSLARGQHLSSIMVRLTPYAVVSGRILDEDGEPPEYMRVSAVRSISRHGKREFWPGRGARTNDLGEYRLFGLAPGRYYLQVTRWKGAFTPRPQASTHNAPDLASVPTYYPGTTDINRAVPVELKAGSQVSGMDFIFAKVRAVRIRGHVTYPTDSSHHGVMLSLEPRGNALLDWSLTQHAEVVDPNGEFELTNVAPGPYTLSAILLDGGNNISAHQQIDVGSENIEDVVVALVTGASLPGRVVFEGPPPANLTQIEIALRDLADHEICFGPVACRLKPGGSFTLKNVGADVYNVVVSALPDGYYVKSIRIGDKEMKESGIDTTKDADGPLVITVSARAGQIEGLVLNGKQEPAPGATVVLVPEPPLRDRIAVYQDVTADQHGRFLIRTIEPGGYKLFAWEVEPDDYMDPQVLQAVDKAGHPVHILEGSRVSADLTLIPKK